MERELTKSLRRRWSHDPAASESPEDVPFDEFFAAMYRPVVSHLLKLGFYLDQAEDAVQDAMADMLVRWEEVQSGAIRSPRSYVRRAAYNSALSRRLRLVRQSEVELQAHSTTPSTRSLESNLTEQTRWVTNLMAALPSSQRSVMALTADGLSADEIAEVLDKKPETVRSHLRHARHRLQQALDASSSADVDPHASGRKLGGTIAKRRLSRQLRAIRESTGLTANGVCERLGWGRGKVGRLEGNHWRRPELSDVRDLLRFYNVTNEQAQELEQLTRLARERAWWQDYPDVFGNSEFPGYEADASRICLYSPLTLPDLLQTTAYTEAMVGPGSRPPAWRNRLLEARRRRQEILIRDDAEAPEVIAVITEASLLFRWGTETQRRHQIEYLLELSRQPRVELRLLLFDNGIREGMCGPINIFDFPGDEPPMVYVQTGFDIRDVADNGYSRDDISAYMDTFQWLWAAAAPLSETEDRLAKPVEPLCRSAHVPATSVPR